MTKILNYKPIEELPIYKAYSLIDVANLLLVKSVDDGDYILDGLFEYTSSLKYESLSEIERKFDGRQNQDRFQSSLNNIRRRYWLPRSKALLEASDYDASVVIIGLMRVHGTLSMRRALRRLPFTSRKQDVMIRHELEELRRELGSQLMKVSRT